MNWLLSDNELENAWLELGDTSLIKIDNNPMLERIDNAIYDANPGLFETSVLRRPEYLGYFCHIILNIDLAPYQLVIIDQLWKHSFPLLVGSRGLGKSWLMAVYSILRCMLLSDHKVIATGPSFRQSKVILEYAEKIFNESNMLRSMCTKSSYLNKSLDHWRFKLNDSQIIGLPIGADGGKIRGMRANTIIADEFKDHNPRIIEEVIFGFAAVASAPMERLKEAARIKAMEEMGVDVSSLKDTNTVKNQSIICGTASYYFEVFYDYWQRYKAIIEHKGDTAKLKSMGIPFDDTHLSYKDFCVLRLPYSIVPEGLYSEKTVARAKTSMSEALYRKEYEAVFVEDSDGFYKRSLIQDCTATDQNITSGKIPSDYCSIPFDCVHFGDQSRYYAMGIDPAFKDDNFAIVILECHKDHARIVYSWTTNEDNFIERKRYGICSEDNYYAFCCRHIRELLKAFNIFGIAVDAQGGGTALIETLSSQSYLLSGEKPLLPVKDPNKRQDTDYMEGHHIIHTIQFANSQWVSQSNHAMLADMEKKRLLFPRFDDVTVELSIAEDQIRADRIAQEFGVSAKKITLYDSLEDVANNIEDLKDELTSISYSKTGQGGIAGREKWSVPEVRIDEAKKSSGKKDRYCALLMANHLANLLRNETSKESPNYLVGSLIRHGAYVNAAYSGSGYNDGSGYSDVFGSFGIVKR